MSQMSPEMNSGQQSSVASTRNGIMALESAYSSILRSLQDVESTKDHVAATYKGTDGYTYKTLLDQWDDQVKIILTNLSDMIDKLNQSLTAHQQTQGSAHDDIDQAYSASEAAFEALAGSI
ncbi:hypothetical protein [Streptomyces griseorubiginosus]|uniref:hypothetical protein n=1 Tax=Streptomyces griseorubiginosus TaxID=67304 RepID=UPI001FCAADF4|nr:hypothetical protein [Streptomyces griseorubiginosus]